MTILEYFWKNSTSIVNYYTPLRTFDFHKIYISERKTIKAFFTNNVDIEAQGTYYINTKIKTKRILCKINQ